LKLLDLNILEDGRSTGLSVRNGGFLLESAAVCLNSFNHPLEVSFPVFGALKQNYLLRRIKVDELAINSFLDLEEATQFGAMGVAVAIMQDQKNMTVKRSWKGTGFDYWVGESDSDNSFKNRIRLEVSGDLKGTDNEIERRLKEKLEQTKKSDQEKIPAFAIIVEFSNPKSVTGSR